MAGTSRFHDKLHRSNHHSVSTVGLIDSAYDPIASHDHPFRGDFILSGALSALNDSTVHSAEVRNNLTVENNSLFRGVVYTNWEAGGVMTHNEAAANTKSGDFTLTLNYNKGVYINGTYGSAARLILGTPGGLFDQGTISVTNVDATSARLTTLTVSSAVGIGTAHPQHSLHVIGDVIIYGTLTANGDSYFQNTLFTTTSSLSIVNTGTGAGLTVSQEGNQPIVAFYDHESSISLWADGDAARPGWVGVKTHTPNVEFTVHGDASASGTVYGSESDSNRWSSVYNTTTANSARWEEVYNTTTTTSATWVSNYTTTVEKSGYWEACYSTTNTNSASWDSGGVLNTLVVGNSALWIANYNYTNAHSANWDANYVLASTNSASWNNTYSAVHPNSAKWNSNYTTCSTKSAAWEAVYASVVSSSASWNAGGGTAGDTYVAVSTNSANWSASYNTLNTNSAHWDANYASTSTNSARWDASYTTLTANSATWGSNYSTTNSNSGDWNSSYITLLANSGTWDAAAGALVDINLDYLADVSITSNTLADGQLLTYDIGTQQWENTSLVLSGFIQGHDVWQSTYNTTNANSGIWSTSYNAVTTNSANWDTGFTSYSIITANSATWNTNSLSGSTDVDISLPTDNAVLQYNTSLGKWVNGTAISTSTTLTAGSLDLTNATISTYEDALTASGEFLVVRVNGVERKLMLWD